LASAVVAAAIGFAWGMDWRKLRAYSTEAPLKLTFLGANRQVTGSCYCLEAAGSRILIDCGMFQERQFQWRNYEPFSVDLKRVDAMVLTHAHLDHVGLIPKLIREGYTGPVFTTKPTIELAELVMTDAAKIQNEDAQYKSKRHQNSGRTSRFPVAPLYSEEHAHQAVKQMRGFEYGEVVAVAPGITAKFRDAGHILGASMVELNVTENGKTRRLLMSGDLGRWDRPLLDDPTLEDGADFAVMESTYGDREHPEEDEGEALRRVIVETVGRGGKVIVPTFAIERAQELMWHLSGLVHAHKVPQLPVYLDSPMAVDATGIFVKYRDWLDEPTRQMLNSGENPMKFPGLHMARATVDSIAINGRPGPAIILSPSGMCTGGRIKHHLRNNIGDPRSTVLFVGYQSEGTLGREILEGAPEVRIHGEFYPVRAKIEQISGFSAHADRSDLMRWLGAFKRPPSRLFLTHGEEKVSLTLAEKIRVEKGWDVTVPAYRQGVEL
jgi:metallo-beta-lactamase family protein